MDFEKFNANPKGWKTGDCVIRALSQATNIPWEHVYKDLCAIGLKKCRMPNDKVVYEYWLAENGWVKNKMPRKLNNNRYTIKEFSQERLHLTAIISVANHLTYIEDNKLIDSWDCSGKSIGNYWTKERR